MNAAKPPGRNFTAVTRPAPTRSTVNRRRDDAVHEDGGQREPERAAGAPDSTDTFTLGWLSTSER